ncbi:MAG: glycosyltransferase family 2 protein [Anaerolineales bacterium]
MFESKPPHPSGVCGILVTYDPSKELASNIASLSSMVPHVIIVDNNSVPEKLHWIDSNKSKRIEIYRNPQNLGIAAALNRGLQRAIELGYPWAITLDQDSRPAAGMVAQLCDAYPQTKDPECIAILAPRIFNRRLDKPTYYLRPRFGPFYERAYCNTGILESVSTVITSGSMINLKYFEELGGYREDFFMDYVDTEYCLRALSQGYTIIVACDAHLDHVLGNRREVRVGKLRLYPTFHPPQRWYTISRNRIVMIRMYAIRFPHWFTYEIVASGYTLVRMLLTEDNRLEKLRAIWRGLLDGLRGRMGEAE